MLKLFLKMFQLFNIPIWQLDSTFYYLHKIVNFKLSSLPISHLKELRPFFGPHLRSKYESGNKRISLHDFIRPIFLVFHFGFSLDLSVH